MLTLLIMQHFFTVAKQLAPSISFSSMENLLQRRIYIDNVYKNINSFIYNILYFHSTEVVQAPVISTNIAAIAALKNLIKSIISNIHDFFGLYVSFLDLRKSVNFFNCAISLLSLNDTMVINIEFSHHNLAGDCKSGIRICSASLLLYI